MYWNTVKSSPPHKQHPNEEGINYRIRIQFTHSHVIPILYFILLYFILCGVNYSLNTELREHYRWDISVLLCLLTHVLVPQETFWKPLCFSVCFSVMCLFLCFSVSRSGQISVFNILSFLLAACPYLLSTVVLLFKCYRARGTTSVWSVSPLSVFSQTIHQTDLGSHL